LVLSRASPGPAATDPRRWHLTALAFKAAVDHPERFVSSALTVMHFTVI
jgi:hypothetical protein